MNKYIRTTVIVAGLLIAVRISVRAYQRYTDSSCMKQLPQNAMPTVVEVQIVPASGDFYDYDRLLALIAKVKNLKTAYRAQYVKIDEQAVAPLDVKETKLLLEDLYREKGRFGRYAKNIKTRYKGNVPLKRARALEYEMQVLEKSTTEVESILRRL